MLHFIFFDILLKNIFLQADNVFLLSIFMWINKTWYFVRIKTAPRGLLKEFCHWKKECL